MGLVTHFEAWTLLLFGLIWFGLVVSLRVWRRKRITYLLYFTVFYMYLYKVLDYTLIQFQSLLLLKYFSPGLILRGQESGKDVNLIPLLTLTPGDLRTSLLNVLLLMPFGFGLPFVARVGGKQTVVIGMLLSITIELLQFMTGYFAHLTFRVADINDVIFNTVGVVIGYWAYTAFSRKAASSSRMGLALQT